MEFYIQLENIGTYFRLQDDKKTWRLISKDFSLLKEDYLSSNIDEIIRLQEINKEVEINGKKWRINPKSGRIGDPQNLFSSVYIKRNSFPLIPDKEQLISTIWNGNDDINNSLILNVNGSFELRNFYDLLEVDDPTIIYRYETFIAGNDYVGEEAAKDEHLINSIFTSALKHWLAHLSSGRTNSYMDESFGGNSISLLEDIKKLKLSWKSG